MGLYSPHTFPLNFKGILHPPVTWRWFYFPRPFLSVTVFAEFSFTCVIDLASALEYDGLISGFMEFYQKTVSPLFSQLHCNMLKMDIEWCLKMHCTCTLIQSREHHLNIWICCHLSMKRLCFRENPIWEQPMPSWCVTGMELHTSSCTWWWSAG